jgi:hypothetical protein
MELNFKGVFLASVINRIACVWKIVSLGHFTAPDEQDSMFVSGKFQLHILATRSAILIEVFMFFLNPSKQMLKWNLRLGQKGLLSRPLYLFFGNYFVTACT